ncbi:unnamed protein product [Eruca vesicaria subsp. sativa]|uniref:Leucine-rich repeat-containing N-terminal plant-type domain-containing protein n=1 Tax=Eruca vesicaria subsp. sativa TaxID=29727 RepID=A0ABC8LNG1_ERUVS|nr:unnamed protein product [Eruca vesicaria subsp. sativa]
MIQNYCYCFSGIIITIYFCLLIHALASPSLHSCRHDQKKALLEFRDEFPTGDPYDLRPWNKSSDCCHWEGVTCDDRYGQVISLDLSEMSLNSSLKTNSSLFRLQYLRHLNFFRCDLQGNIPSSLGNLSRLTLVDLSYNNLVGEIPASIGYLNHLTELSLSFNHLVGEVPVSMGNLNGLRVIDLGGNSLGGHFPILFANLTKLTDLDISFNKFTSILPSDMSGFHNLELFDVYDNSFVGPLPKSLFSIPSLQSLYLGENQFMGPIQLGNTSLSAFELKNLDLSDNNFDGPIPECISGFINLSHLYLDHNDFTGSHVSCKPQTVMNDFGRHWYRISAMDTPSLFTRDFTVVNGSITFGLYSAYTRLKLDAIL